MACELKQPSVVLGSEMNSFRDSYQKMLTWSVPARRVDVGPAVIRALILAEVKMLVITNTTVAYPHAIHVDTGDVVDVVLNVIMVLRITVACRNMSLDT
jgi:hypothetical protein